jgi:outer membrane protein assembly factor BamB
MRVFILVGLLATSATLSAENWPQWRGPHLNGVSRETNLPVTWNQTTNITWKLPLPSWSGATPIIWNNHIFLNVANGENLFLWAVDRAKGAKLWERPLGGGNHKERKQNMSSLGPRHPGRVRAIRPELGICQLAAAPRGSSLCPGAARDENGRPVVRDED